MNNCLHLRILLRVCLITYHAINETDWWLMSNGSFRLLLVCTFRWYWFKFIYSQILLWTLWTLWTHCLSAADLNSYSEAWLLLWSTTSSAKTVIVWKLEVFRASTYCTHAPHHTRARHLFCFIASYLSFAFSRQQAIIMLIFLYYSSERVGALLFLNMLIHIHISL